MKEINWEKLFNDHLIVFHCETEEIANQLLQIAHQHGHKWRSGESYLEKNSWHVYGKETCYYIIDNTYESLNFFNSLNVYNLNIINVKILFEGKRQPFKLKRKEIITW